MGNKIQAGDVLFVWGDGWIEKGIEFITHGACHVAVFVSENKLYEAQGGRALGECDLSFYLENPKIKRLEVWTDPTWTDEERTKVPDVAEQFKGIAYDYPVILAEIPHFEFGMNIDWYNNHGKLDCSEFAEAFAEKFGKHWSKLIHPAPVDEEKGGVLVRKLVLKG